MNKLIVFVGPSGAGKSLISNFLIQGFSKELNDIFLDYDENERNLINSSLDSIRKNIEKYNFKKIITSTTRPPRDGEFNGVDYHFYNRSAFKDKIINGDFLEYVENFNNYYGTCFTSIKNSLEVGHSLIILDDDGATKLKELLKEQVITFYLDIPIDVMKKRLHIRNDDEASMELRLSNLKITKFKEIADFNIDSSNRIDIVLSDILSILNSNMK
ncbi:MAG: guanylate kinase [Clostridium sp.]